MPVQVEPFSIEVISGEPWPELTPVAGRGLARLLQDKLEQAGLETQIPIRGLLWISDRWQAELHMGGERRAEEAAFAQPHHLLCRLAEWAARQLHGELPERLLRSFEDLQTPSPGAMLAYWTGLGSPPSQARAAWQRAFELDPHFVAARLALAQSLLDTGGALITAAALAQGLTVSDSAAAAELGLALWAAGEIEVAFELLQSAVRADPQNALTTAALAALMVRRGLEGVALEEARLLAAHSTQLASDDYRCWAALADVHRAAGEFDQAGFYYGFALRLEPAAPTVLKDAGACWLLARQPARALPLIERALEASPADAENFGNLAFARDLLGEPAAALEAARRAAALRPADARLLILHGDLALKAGEREEALTAWARATELEPSLTLNPEGGNIGLPGGEPATAE